MTLADFHDANKHLDGTKIEFASNADAAQEASVADAIVRAKLFDTFPDNVGLWDYDPTVPQEDTPALIRVIAGMLMAAQRYEKSYSEETLDGNDYAARLRAQALSMLDQIVTGQLSLDDVTYEIDAFGEAMFYPNDSTIIVDPAPVGLLAGDPDRRFEMGTVF